MRFLRGVSYGAFLTGAKVLGAGDGDTFFKRLSCTRGKVGDGGSKPLSTGMVGVLTRATAFCASFEVLKPAPHHGARR
jgi:hypothetical protein